jgi:hypothetical protein
MVMSSGCQLKTRLSPAVHTKPARLLGVTTLATLLYDVETEPIQMLTSPTDKAGSPFRGITRELLIGEAAHSIIRFTRTNARILIAFAMVAWCVVNVQLDVQHSEQMRPWQTDISLMFKAQV